jgi:hypothetical protein
MSGRSPKYNENPFAVRQNEIPFGVVESNSLFPL